MLKEFKLYCYIKQTNQKLAPSSIRIDSHRIRADSGIKRMSSAHPTHFRANSNRARVDSHSKSQMDALPLEIPRALRGEGRINDHLKLFLLGRCRFNL